MERVLTGFICEKKVKGEKCSCDHELSGNVDPAEAVRLLQAKGKKIENYCKYFYEENVDAKTALENAHSTGRLEVIGGLEKKYCPYANVIFVKCADKASNQECDCLKKFFDDGSLEGLDKQFTEVWGFKFSDWCTSTIIHSEMLNFAENLETLTEEDVNRIIKMAYPDLENKDFVEWHVARMKDLDLPTGWNARSPFLSPREQEQIEIAQYICRLLTCRVHDLITEEVKIQTENSLSRNKIMNSLFYGILEACKKGGIQLKWGKGGKGSKGGKKL